MELVKTLKKRIALISKSNKELIVDSGFAIGIRILAAVSAFLMNMVVARQLGAFESGNFFLCFAVVTVLATFIRLGGDNLVLRYVSINSVNNQWQTINLILKKLISRIIFFSLILFAVLISLNKEISTDIFHKPEVAPTFLWMLLSTPLLAMSTIFAYAFQGLKKVIFSVAIQNILTPLFLVIIIFIFRPDRSSITGIYYFIASLATFIITVFSWYKTVPSERNVSDQAILPEKFWKSSYSLWLFALVQMGMLWSGQFIASMYVKQDQLAQLAVSQRTSMLISFILIAVNLVSAPRFAHLYNDGKLDALKKYAINSTRLMMIFAAPIVLIILFFPGFILSLFGKGFEEGTVMLQVLALGQFINVITGSVTLLLMMSGHEKDMRNIQFFIGILSVILNFVLIHAYSVLGAAVATSISISLQNLICVRMVKKRLGFNTMAIWKN